MKLYKTENGPVLEERGEFFQLADNDWDVLLNRGDHAAVLTSLTRRATKLPNFNPQTDAMAPIGNQEVWAAGVTYYRSRTARMEESKDAGGGSFYDRVYDAARPELFFKATPSRVAGTNQNVRIRRDSKWNVPEPELTLVVNSLGQIIGYTIGNDMSSRDIEGENPLYLPQAKVYSQSCGLGPGILLSEEPLPATTEIQLEILRGGATAFHGQTSLKELKRDPKELVEYLYRDNEFPYGCFLLTGTGIVPPDEFTLQSQDEIRITIDGIGTLVNFVIDGR
ncbi:MAG: fumarylacetoacetate hydrolase family protein [Acidobacteriota bacterium]|nr:fumarylacetoacetate hydrolase family protein [Acidobacteriota bacterium]